MEKVDDRPKIIDIKEVIASKNANLLKWLPRFMLRYLTRILHESEIPARTHPNPLSRRQNASREMSGWVRPPAENERSKASGWIVGYP